MVTPDVGQAHTLKMDYLSTGRRLFELVWRPSPLFFCATLVLTILGGLTPVAGIVLNARIIDALVGAVQDAPTTQLELRPFVWLIVLFGALRVAEQLLTQLLSATEELYQTKVTNHVQLLLADKAASLDLAFFEDPAFQTRMSTATNEASYRPLQIVMQLIGMVAQATTLISVTVILALWHLWMPPLIFGVALAAYLISAHFSRAKAKLIMERMPLSQRAIYFTTLLSADWTVKEIRLFSLQEFLLSSLRKLQNTMYAQDRRLEGRRVAFTSLAEVCLALTTTLLVGFTGLSVLRRGLSIGDFTLYTQAIFQFQTGLLGLMMTLARSQENYLFVVNLFEFLETEPIVEAKRPAASAAEGAERISARPTLEFRDVSFRYTEHDPYILKGVSFTLRPGAKVALVGENGAGKTTLVKLMSGLYEPSEGQILLDGVDVQTLDRSTLRSYLGVIFQDYLIYHLPLYTNIGVGKVEAIDEREQVWRAARRSGLDKLAQTLPEGYDTVLERFIDRGHELSGGQQQLVAITRALMRDAPLLVLDEPTAALDPQAEENFFQRLLEEPTYAAQSVIFISHRFSTIRRAEHILVLEGGVLSEQGSHRTLLAQGGLYATLFNLQAKLYASDSDDTSSAAAPTIGR